MKTNEIIRLASVCFPDVDTSQVQSKSLCRLWAGMGQIYRVDVLGSHRDPFVIKHIQPPHQLDSIGDRRKAASYVVEANFYEKLVPSLRKTVRLPERFHVEHLPHNEIIICMSYVEEEHRRMNQEQYTKAVLTWLASLHASHWGTVDDIVESVGLQPMGSYWHLDTRPDEHASMSNKGWEGRLKLAARAIDERLKQDPYQCLIHGDAKDANVIPMSDGTICMVDFQYCGKGTPTRDLAYFLCTGVDLDREQEYLTFYLEQLQSRVPKGSPTPSLSELQESLDLAYCDFCRFMCGWGHWGGDLQGRVKQVLHRLDSGKNLGSEEAYITAMEREYGV